MRGSAYPAGIDLSEFSHNEIGGIVYRLADPFGHYRDDAATKGALGMLAGNMAMSGYSSMSILTKWYREMLGNGSDMGTEEPENVHELLSAVFSNLPREYRHIIKSGEHPVLGDVYDATFSTRRDLRNIARSNEAKKVKMRVSYHSSPGTEREPIFAVERVKTGGRIAEKVVRYAWSEIVRTSHEACTSNPRGVLPGCLLKDIFGLGLVVRRPETMEDILNISHSRSEFDVEESEDYYSNPKPSGYRAHHLIMVPTAAHMRMAGIKNPFELQLYEMMPYLHGLCGEYSHEKYRAGWLRLVPGRIRVDRADSSSDGSQEAAVIAAARSSKEGRKLDNAMQEGARTITEYWPY